MKKTPSNSIRPIDYWGVKRLLDQPGLSVGGFAEIWGISPQYLYNLLRNKVVDRCGTLRRPAGFDNALAEYLGCNVNELYQPRASRQLSHAASAL
jgi:hypothetical protein